MALQFQIRDRKTPGNPVISVTEMQWRTLAARYIRNVDAFEAALIADTNFAVFPDYDMWLTNGAYSPGIPFVTSPGNTPAGAKPSHRQNNTPQQVGQSTE